MKHILRNLTLLLTVLFSNYCYAQTATWSESFTQSVGATTQCTSFQAFCAGLNPTIYNSVKIYGSLNPTGIICNDPTIANAVAAALKNGTNYTSPTCNGNVWSVCNRGNHMELWLNPPAQCSGSNCPTGSAYIIRPCISSSNPNWGGVNSNTCGAPSQTMALEFNAGPPCAIPTNLNATNILSTTATGSWTPGASSTNHEYILNTSATAPTAAGTTTTLSSINFTGLTPATTYYLHVRNKCTSGNFSFWVTYSFTTLPPCLPPIGFNVTNLQPTSATINWNVWPSALTYDYLVDQSRNDPTSTTGVTNIPGTSVNLSSLTENTWYYVHIRSKCAANEQSPWSLDSFLTPIPCRAPLIKIDHINTDQAVAYWDPVPTALYYDYALTTSSTPPSLGTRYDFTSLLASSLYDGKDYYIHVRSHCNSVGIEGVSDWGTASFRTFPTSVANMNNAGFSLDAYPNPVTDVLVIKLSGQVKGAGNIAITDVSGKTVHTASIHKAETSVSMKGLPAGLYLIRYTDQARTEIIKITKQ